MVSAARVAPEAVDKAAVLAFEVVMVAERLFLTLPRRMKVKRMGRRLEGSCLLNSLFVENRCLTNR